MIDFNVVLKKSLIKISRYIYEKSIKIEVEIFMGVIFCWFLI